MDTTPRCLCSARVQSGSVFSLPYHTSHVAMNGQNHDNLSACVVRPARRARGFVGQATCAAPTFSDAAARPPDGSPQPRVPRAHHPSFAGQSQRRARSPARDFPAGKRRVNTTRSAQRRPSIHRRGCLGNTAPHQSLFPPRNDIRDVPSRYSLNKAQHFRPITGSTAATRRPRPRVCC